MLLKNPDRYIDKEGAVFLTEESAIEALYSGSNIHELQILDSEKYLEMVDFFNIQIPKEKTFSKDQWYIPIKYHDIDIEQYFNELCKTDIEKNRIQYEILIYKKHNLEQFLRCVIYISDTLKKSDVVWGIGRGSACASYCLYLLDIHAVNSIEYDLDFSEFLD